MHRSIHNGGSLGRREASQCIDRNTSRNRLGDLAAGCGTWFGIGLEEREGFVGSSANRASLAELDMTRADVGSSGDVVSSD